MNRQKGRMRKVLTAFLSLCVISTGFHGAALANMIDSGQHGEIRQESGNYRGGEENGIYREATGNNSCRETTESDSGRETAEGDGRREATESDSHGEATEGDSHGEATESDSHGEVTESNSHGEATESNSRREVTESDNYGEATESDSRRETAESGSQKEKSESDCYREDDSSGSETDTDPLSSLTMNLYKYNYDTINRKVLGKSDRFQQESYDNRFFMMLKNDKNSGYSHFTWKNLTGGDGSAGKRFHTGIHNEYIPPTAKPVYKTDGRENKEGGVLHGIVADEYDKGKIVLAAPYHMGDFGDEHLTGIAALFPQNESEGGRQNQENENGVTPFYNVKLGENTFHYTEGNGRYTFCALTWDELMALKAWKTIDAEEVNEVIRPIHFNNIDTNQFFDVRQAEPGEDGRYVLEGYEGEVWNGGGGGFLPFGFGKKEESGRTVNPDHYLFGMTLSFGFDLPSDGTIAEDEEIKFRFVGDDDVWIYLKDQESDDACRLALDLGGPHDAAFGDINFATGLITYQGVYDEKKNLTYSEPAYWYLYEEHDSELTPTEDGKWELDGKIIEKCVGITRAAPGTSKRFSCDMYYLERGMMNANCFIDMNLPVIPENEDNVKDDTGRIRVQKKITGTDMAQIDKNFMIHLKSTEEGQYMDTSVVLGNENGENHWISDWIAVDGPAVLEMTETRLKEFTIDSVVIEGKDEVTPIPDEESGESVYRITVEPGDEVTVVVTNQYQAAPYFHSASGVMNHFDADKRPVER